VDYPGPAIRGVGIGTVSEDKVVRVEISPPAEKNWLGDEGSNLDRQSQSPSKPHNE